MNSWYVPDNGWNRVNNPELIGRVLSYVPSYISIRPSKFPSVEYEIAELNVITAVAVSRLGAAIEGVRRIYA